MERVTVYMTEKMAQTLNRMGDDIGVSRSNLVSMICYEWLRDQLRPHCRVRVSREECGIKRDN